jgi:DNA ligase-1
LKAFTDLYLALDATTSGNAKLAAMAAYFSHAPPEDAAWAAYFLSGGKPRQIVPTKWLRHIAQEAAGVSAWLFEESYEAVGDLAETMALLLPTTLPVGEESRTEGLRIWIEEYLLPLRGLPLEQITPRLITLWSELDTPMRFVSIKLMTGGLRVGVSKLLVTRALAQVSGMDSKHVAQRLVGYTDITARPTAARYLALLAKESENESTLNSGQPYPFFLAHPLPALLNQPTEIAALLGSCHHWLAEWKWDGIRAQLVRRVGQTWLWSRGEELITERFPELAAIGENLPDGTVLDGEIVVWQNDHAQPFALLQQRIGRKTLNAKILREAPVILLAYDLLEWQGNDQRGISQAQRRVLLEQTTQRYPHPALQLSPLINASNWEELAQQRAASRTLCVEGVMLKAQDARYGVGRTKNEGVWWKWKIDPLTIDAVLIYAQRGHGRRASLYSDYTFAVWNAVPGAPDRMLVPFAKAYSGLTDEEMHRVDAIIRQTTVEKFGPVRRVTPTLVFELGFEAIARSARHKSGIAVRFPRMLRWRIDKPVEEADSLETLLALLPPMAS